MDSQPETLLRTLQTAEQSLAAAMRLVSVAPDRDAEAPEPTVAQLCREWRLVNAKLQYDLACLTDGKDSDDICTAANHRIYEIEEELADAKIEDLDDAQAVLSIIGKNMDEELMGEDRDRAMLRAVHRGMNYIRNKLTPTT